MTCSAGGAESTTGTSTGSAPEVLTGSSLVSDFSTSRLGSCASSSPGSPAFQFSGKLISSLGPVGSVFSALALGGIYFSLSQWPLHREHVTKNEAKPHSGSTHRYPAERPTGSNALGVGRLPNVRWALACSAGISK